MTWPTLEQTHRLPLKSHPCPKGIPLPPRPAYLTGMAIGFRCWRPLPLAAGKCDSSIPMCSCLLHRLSASLLTVTPFYWPIQQATLHYIQLIACAVDTAQDWKQLSATLCR